jgi:hypothetical protein
VVDTRHQIQYLSRHCSLGAAAAVEAVLEEVLLNARVSVVELAGWMRRDSTVVVEERISVVDTT